MQSCYELVTNSQCRPTCLCIFFLNFSYPFWFPQFPITFLSVFHAYQIIEPQFWDDWIKGSVGVIHSFILAISIAPLQVLYYSEALPTTAWILYRSFTLKHTIISKGHHYFLCI